MANLARPHAPQTSPPTVHVPGHCRCSATAISRRIATGASRRTTPASARSCTCSCGPGPIFDSSSWAAGGFPARGCKTAPPTWSAAKAAGSATRRFSLPPRRRQVRCSSSCRRPSSGPCTSCTSPPSHYHRQAPLVGLQQLPLPRAQLTQEREYQNVRVKIQYRRSKTRPSSESRRGSGSCSEDCR